MQACGAWLVEVCIGTRSKKGSTLMWIRLGMPCCAAAPLRVTGCEFFLPLFLSMPIRNVWIVQRNCAVGEYPMRDSTKRVSPSAQVLPLEMMQPCMPWYWEGSRGLIAENQWKSSWHKYYHCKPDISTLLIDSTVECQWKHCPHPWQPWRKKWPRFKPAMLALQNLFEVAIVYRFIGESVKIMGSVYGV